MPKCSLINRHCRKLRSNSRKASNCRNRDGAAGATVKAFYRPKEVCRRQNAAAAVATSMRRHASRARRRRDEAARRITAAVRSYMRLIRGEQTRLEQAAREIMFLGEYGVKALREGYEVLYGPLATCHISVFHHRVAFETKGVITCLIPTGGPGSWGPPKPNAGFTLEADAAYTREHGVPFICRKRTGRWTAEFDPMRGAAVQPRAATIRLVDYDKRIVQQVPQVRGSPNFYLSTGFSNPLNNFPDTFFRNSFNYLTSSYVYKCNPLGTWFSSLLRACCSDSDLTLHLLDPGPGRDARSREFARKHQMLDTQSARVCRVHKLLYTHSENDWVLQITATDVDPRFVGTVLTPQVEFGSEDTYTVARKRIHTDDYRLSACNTIDLLLLPFLTKFCNWRDLQVSACLGGLWDAEEDYVGLTQRDRDGDLTTIDFGAIRALKYMLQHYDYDELTQEFIDRAVPLEDLTAEEKAALRRRP